MNKVVLISGGTQGIGKAVVFSLLESGCSVVTFSPHPETVVELSKECTERGFKDRARVFDGDVTSDSDVARIVDATLKEFGRIDVLINNAGIPYYTECDSVDMEMFLRVLDVNLVGAARLVKAVVPDMKARRAGLVINMVSTAGIYANARSECYAATKFGLRGYSQGIRNELREFGIKVATISPGIANTEFLGKEMESRSHEKNSLLETEDIARTIRFVVEQPEHVEIRDILLTPFGSDRYTM